MPWNHNIIALAAAAAAGVDAAAAAAAAAAAGAVCIMLTKIIHKCRYDRVIFATVISKMAKSQVAKLLSRRALKTQMFLP